MICTPCRVVHTAADCVDSLAGREHPWRHCFCQHKPRALAGAVPVSTAQPLDVDEEETD